MAYITKVPGPDPFWTQNDVGGVTDKKVYDSYDYVDAKSSYDHHSTIPSLYGRMWRMCSAGPDQVQSYGGSTWAGGKVIIYGFYDPTNGTRSAGDIVRLGPKGPYYTQYDIGFSPE